MRDGDRASDTCMEMETQPKRRAMRSSIWRVKGTTCVLFGQVHMEELDTDSY